MIKRKPPRCANSRGHDRDKMGTAMPRTLINIDDLRKLIRADFATGKLFWLERPRHFFKDDASFKKWNSRHAGKEAFTSSNGFGYAQGSILNQKYSGHHVVWALHYGKWPTHQIDHINGIRHDNRIENLRDVPQSQNVKNSRLSSRNTSGICGVRWDRDRHKWSAYGKSGGPIKNLGRYDCIGLAIKARFGFQKEHDFSPRHGAT